MHSVVVTLAEFSDEVEFARVKTLPVGLGGLLTMTARCGC